ncbi:MAG: hypothetical protein LDL30_06935 [Desulfovibrio sp.]|nr:hypothetical protein [Desulfovibrio sp.]
MQLLLTAYHTRGGLKMKCLYKKQFETVEELDAFVCAFRLLRGIEFCWNRLERTAWLWCDRELYRELQACQPAMAYEPCESLHA